MKCILIQNFPSCLKTASYSSSPSTPQIICNGVVVAFSSPEGRVKFERRQILVPREVLLMLESGTPNRGCFRKMHVEDC